MDAKLEYLGNSVEISNFTHCAEDEKGGNRYNSTFDLTVVSNGFSGRAKKCECDLNELKRFAEELKTLLSNETKKAVFQEIGYGSRVSFESDGRGHIEVSGAIYGEVKIQSLQFAFTTDQTVYAPFIGALEDLQ